MSTSDRLSLPYIAPQQAQKHVTHNEAIRRLDAIVQASVKDRDIAAPPSSPNAGDAYIAASGASGDWVGGDNALFVYQDGVWVQFDPRPGWIIWLEDEGAAIAWNGSAWIGFGGTGGLTASDLANGAADRLGVNTSGDATNRLAAKSDAILFNHDDVTPGSGDCQVKINKAAVADTAALLFQTGASGRAEFGLTGDDDFHVKVSADGTAWTEAFFVDKDDGSVGIGTTSPDDVLHVSGGSVKVENAQPNITLKDSNSTGDAQEGFLEFRDSANTQTGYFGLASGGNNEIYFWNAASGGGVIFGANNATAVTIDGSDSGVVVGSPSGGSKGLGTLNAQAVYDDNALLSCYVFDQALDGMIDVDKWDAKVPDRVMKGEKHRRTGPQTEDRIERRRHEPMRRFAARMGTQHDPLTLDGYAKHWREKRHLSSLPNEATFNPENGMSAGAWVQRLIETVEIQAVLIEALNQRTKRLVK